MSSAALNLALSIDSNIRRADPTTIKNKFLVGYQGWFNCHGDGEPVGPGHHGWIHWFTHPVPHGGTLNIDYWPDTSQYSQEELFDAPGFKNKDGSPARLFSSRNPKTVQRHFHWMAENGVDGVFLQRFLGLCDIASGGNNGNRRIRDEVGDNVQRAAEREGRVYAIMYDVTGVQPERIQEIIEADWNHLLQEKRVLNSPNYLREDGKPVIAIWGLGLKDRNHTPAQVRALTSFFRSSTPGGAYLVAGTAAHWRTSDSDADPNPEFVNTWMESFDAISPWTVGRYSDQTSADAFAENRIQGDVMFIGKWATTRGRRVDYLPVVHPGGSGFNMSNGHWARNGAPREGGRFLWRQIYNARKLGARMMYGAMWDEYDEGTQFMPAIAKTAALPQDESRRFKLIAYDVDGYDVPPDWYMRIAGYGSALLKGERYIEDRFPEKDLRDWAPKYEERATLQSLLASGSGSGSTSGQGQSSRDVLSIVEQTKGQDEIPPPPYSLTDEGSSSAKPILSQGPEPPLSTRPDLVRQESRPPPPVPPRIDSRSSRPYGVAPAVPLASRPRPTSTSPPRSPPVSLSPRQTPPLTSHRPTPPLTSHRPTPPLTGPRPTPPLTSSRPTSPLTSPPRSPAPLQHRPSVTAYHDQAPTSPYHTSAPQPAPMLSSYPGQHMQVQRPPSVHGHGHGPQRHDSGSSSFIAPTIQLPMPNIPSIPQPGDAWSPSLSAQPTWSQDWKRPGPMPPAQFPTPGPVSSSYDYQSPYNEPYGFPEASRPTDYGFPALHTPQILEPQQLNPGPPPPIHSRPRSTPPGHALDAPPPGRSYSARSPSPSHQDLKSRSMADKYADSTASNVGYPDGDRKRKDSLIHRISSAAGGKLSKFTK